MKTIRSFFVQKQFQVKCLTLDYAMSLDPYVFENLAINLKANRQQISIFKKRKHKL